MTFDQALLALRTGGVASRSNWTCVLHMMTVICSDGEVSQIFREWPSGHTSPYEPTHQDIVASDWVTAAFPDQLAGKGYNPSTSTNLINQGLEFQKSILERARRIRQ